ncbi:glyoxalase [Lacinutrix sp. C3R15]|uniref:glyoxalase n=1 Tax=Flavobacteriaceae TaxID=49546 RepID=UPI001C09E41D|nr:MULTISPECIES: glyoxalase [Flavobacteriaceae]MBU2938588.1 glyoxalase [Lacinutrix sp. C3R15]MDO6621902.1 glyoxalase [Oceanihabitans sp. 1_MG-2023]
MNTRDLNLKQARPEIASIIINDDMTADERFQNLVLRPIAKLQVPLFIEVFKNYAKKHKSVFYELSIEKRICYIENALQKDMKLRNSYKGMVIGLFTTEEYLVYIKNSSALNKRMMSIVKDQLLGNIQLLEKPEFLAAV